MELTESADRKAAWLSGRRTTLSSRRFMRCVTPRWQSGWRMWRRPFLASWQTKFTPQQSSSVKEILFM